METIIESSGRTAADSPERNPSVVDSQPSDMSSQPREAHGGGEPSSDMAGPVAEGPARRKETRRRRAKGLGGLQQERTGIWTLRALVNGKRISKSTGTRDRAEAEQFAKRFLAPYVKDDAAKTYENIQVAVMTERQLAEMREAEGPQMKLEDAWKAYEESPYRRDLSPSTLEGKKQVCRVFTDWMARMFPEVIEVRQVSRYHTEKYLDYMRKENSASTYNNRLCVLREVHRNIMEKAAARHNPWDGFPLRADDSHSRRELTIEELARLVERANDEGPEWRTLFGIAMYTGMRLGDCCKLTWAEVDIVRSIIQKIPEKTKKYRKGRPVTIPIHKVLADLLMQTPVEKRTGYVLPVIGEKAQSGPNGMGWIHHRINRIFKNSGIVMSVAVEGRKHKVPEASFHSLRHTFVSLSANAGVPLHIVQAIVGHESTAMTRHYYHENAAALAQAVEAIPSISETGDVSEGEVAPPDASRMMGNRVSPFAQIRALPPTAPAQLPVAASVPPLAEDAAQAATASPVADIEAEDAVVIGVPQTVTGADGVARENPHADAPLVGRSAERNALRRENKAAEAAAANADAQRLGGWGNNGQSASTLPSVNRRQRNEWIGKVIRQWSKQKKAALLEGTAKLVANGGYRFLQELWERGVPMTNEDAIDALEVFLSAKNG